MSKEKARKHNSSILKELLDEVSPLEMGKTKNKMLLAARIEDLMINKGWNKTKLAIETGKHRSEVTKWLSGTQNLTVDVLSEIANALGTSISNLFEEKKPIVLREHIVIKHITTSNPVIILETPSAHNNNNEQKHIPIIQSTDCYSFPFQNEIGRA